MDFLPSFLPFLWIAVMILMAVIEGLTTQLVSVWFVVGAFVAAIVAFFVPSFPLQLVVFAVVSLFCLFFTRPLIMRSRKINHEPTNADRNIGKIAVVTQEINNIEGTGQVKVGGNTWTARTENDTVIPVGCKVTVNEIKGVRLIVSADKSAVKNL